MKPRWLAATGVALAATCAFGAPARAELVQAVVVKQQFYQQTGPGVVVPINGGVNASFGAIAAAQGAADFDSVALTYSGPGSPIALTKFGPVFLSPAPTYETPAALDAAFPAGTYTFDAENSVTLASQSVAVDYVNDFSFDTLPQLDAATWSALANIDPTQDLTLHFSAFTPDPSAQTAYKVIELIGGGAVHIYQETPSSTQFTIPANIMAPGQTYSLSLVFGQQNQSQAGPLARISADVLIDDVSFTVPVAVPEPGTWSVALIGLGLVGARLRRRAAVAAA
jgi:hypothetical protein